MIKHHLKAPLLAAASLPLWHTAAQAHAFRSGADGYEKFLEGGSVIIAYPGVLLPLLALGLIVGLWQAEGMVRALPAFLAGLIIGFPLSAIVGPSIAIALIALGVFTAALAALLPQHNKIQCLALAFLTGLLVMMVSLEGHGLFELSFFIYFGIFIVANMVFMATANMTRMALDRFPNQITNIIARVAASWIAAMLLLFLALEWRG